MRTRTVKMTSQGSLPPLAAWLELAVPLHIEGIKARGGPGERDQAHAQAFSPVLVEKADVLLFGSKKAGEAAELANGLAHAIAVLSFAPGGVTVFGQHWGSLKT